MSKQKPHNKLISLIRKNPEIFENEKLQRIVNKYDSNIDSKKGGALQEPKESKKGKKGGKAKEIKEKIAKEPKKGGKAKKGGKVNAKNAEQKENEELEKIAEKKNESVN